MMDVLRRDWHIAPLVPGGALKRTPTFAGCVKVGSRGALKRTPTKREATSGFEPLVQLLQSRALPLGDVAAARNRKGSGRRGSNPRLSPWQGDALPLSHSRMTSTVQVPHSHL